MISKQVYAFLKAYKHRPKIPCQLRFVNYFIFINHLCSVVFITTHHGIGSVFFKLFEEEYCFPKYLKSVNSPTQQYY